MKRRDLIQHLESHGCELLREGGRHSWWHNPLRTGVPQFQDTGKSMTILPERYAGISA